MEPLLIRYAVFIPASNSAGTCSSCATSSPRSSPRSPLLSFQPTTSPPPSRTVPPRAPGRARAARGTPPNEYINKGNRADSVRATLASHGLPNLEGKWYFAGPFDNTDQAGFDFAYPPEKGVDLKAAYTGKGDGEVRLAGVQGVPTGPGREPDRPVPRREGRRGRLPVPRVRVANRVQASAVARQRRHDQCLLQRQARVARGPRPRRRGPTRISSTWT